jgi:hypothetical protein
MPVELLADGEAAAEIPRPRKQPRRRDLRRTGRNAARLADQRLAVEDLGGAEQYRDPGARLAGHDVEAEVDAVDPVDVGVTPREVHGLVARRPPAGEGVARPVVRTEVGLDLDDPRAHAAAPELALELAAEQVARHDVGGTKEERIRKRP